MFPTRHEVLCLLSQLLNAQSKSGTVKYLLFDFLIEWQGTTLCRVHHSMLTSVNVLMSMPVNVEITCEGG